VKKKNSNNVDIQYFYANSNFFQLLLSTKKYKEFYCSFEGIFSIILAVITIIVFFVLYNHVNIVTFNEIIKDISLAVIAGLISVLGFVVGGLAIITGTINERVIFKINKKGLAQYLIGILFSFYFLGYVIGLTLIAFSFLFLLSFIDSILVTTANLIVITFIYGYLFWFIIWYSIALLGTCLKIFLVNYRFSDNNDLTIESIEKED
jgi:hypothetical protein